ncbi:MAG: hypothetical protein H0X16_09620 [Chloroflexi bacterium]|nr:hypothetical protein [Chloroflexota bacterium]
MEEARRVAAKLSAQNRGWDGPDESLLGPADLVVEKLAPYLELGFRHVYFDLPAPFDTETLERLMAEVKPRLTERSAKTLVSQGR